MTAHYCTCCEYYSLQGFKPKGVSENHAYFEHATSWRFHTWPHISMLEARMTVAAIARGFHRDRKRRRSGGGRGGGGTATNRMTLISGKQKTVGFEKIQLLKIVIWYCKGKKRFTVCWRKMCSTVVAANRFLFVVSSFENSNVLKEMYYCTSTGISKATRVFNIFFIFSNWFMLIMHLANFVNALLNSTN